MRVVIKLTGRLYSAIRNDLARPHPFALERVGFVLGRLSDGDSCKILFLTTYHAVPDDEYVDDASVGARIGPYRITWAMQAAHRGRMTGEGVFHVHAHRHQGEPTMSKTDLRELPALMPGLRAVNPDCAHGIIILSEDHGAGWFWLPGTSDVTRTDSISVIGVPLEIFVRN
jgi:hypothetical protein